MSHPYTMAKQEHGGSWYWNVYDPSGKCIARFPIHYGIQPEALEHATKFLAQFAPWEF